MIADVALIPRQASSTAGSIDTIFIYVTVVCGVVGAAVAVLLIAFCIRYRRRPGERGNPAETVSSNALEIAWTILPMFFFVSFFIWGAKVYFDAFRAPDDAATVYCIGKQWMWKFQHPEGQREIDELHVPVGKPVRVVLTSEDVIHSFFVPAFRVHMDVLPERYTSVWFRPTEEGTYHLFCSQYCGTNHSAMTGVVVVMRPDEYRKWLNLHAEGSMALEGRKKFLKYRCDSCHFANVGAPCPVLEDLYGQSVILRDGSVVKADETYIRRKVLNPSDQIPAGYEDIMPSFRGQLDEDDILQIIAYLKSLKRGETPPRVESYPQPRTTPPIEN